MIQKYKTDEKYDWYLNKDAEIHKQKLQEQKKAHNFGTLGKYLFFGDDYNELYNLGSKLVRRYDLSLFCISKVKRNAKGFSHVLKVYDYSDRFSRNIVFHVPQNVNYRYWKPEFFSQRGIYSKQYLQNSEK